MDFRALHDHWLRFINTLIQKSNHVLAPIREACEFASQLSSPGVEVWCQWISGPIYMQRWPCYHTYCEPYPGIDTRKILGNEWETGMILLTIGAFPKGVAERVSSFLFNQKSVQPDTLGEGRYYQPLQYTCGYTDERCGRGVCQCSCPS